MEAISIKDLNVKYKSGNFALRDINLTIKEGDFVVLTGGTGSGKSTLLRQLKREFALIDYTGSIKVLSVEVRDATIKDTLNVGYVMQFPNEQIVTDKVFHELSFGLENMGLNTDEIRLRVSECAHYFGLSQYMDKSTKELSGGEMQIVNLASVMAMRPKILLLDEPTSQLDEISAEKFISLVYRLNRELGITVIIAEHRLEMLDKYDKMLIMDDGKIIYDGIQPKDYDELPIYTKVGELFEEKSTNIVECRELLKRKVADGTIKTSSNSNIDSNDKSVSSDNKLNNHDGNSINNATNDSEDMSCTCDKISSDNSNKMLDNIVSQDSENAQYNITQNNDKIVSQNKTKKRQKVLKLSNIYFRYNKDEKDVLKGVDLEVFEGEILSIIGANGVGKSTLLKVIANALPSYKGLYKNYGNKVVYLPQNMSFNCDSVQDEIDDAIRSFVSTYAKSDKKHKKSAEEIAKKREKLVNISTKYMDLFDLKKVEKLSPYEISGGERAKLGILIGLLGEPKVLLLDEPTKGLDRHGKKLIKDVLKGLISDDLTVILVSHDIEFVSEVSSRIGTLFDGQILSICMPKLLLSTNYLYTTCAKRVTRDIIDDIVSEEELIEVIKNGR